MDPNFYSIIPANVRYSEDLTDFAKLLFGEITALTTKNGYCSACNATIAGWYKTKSERTVSRAISQLHEFNFIFVEITKTHEGTFRKIFPLMDVHGRRQNCPLHLQTTKLSIPGTTKLSIQKNIINNSSKSIKSKKEAGNEEVILDDTNEEKENKKSSAKKIKKLLEPENGNYFQFQIAFQELSKKPEYDANGFPPHWTDELKLAFVEWCNIFSLKKKNRWGYRPQITDEFDNVNEYLIKWTAEQITDCLKYAKSKSNSNYFPEWTLKNIEKQNKTKTKKKSGKRATNYDKVRNQLSDPNFLKS